MPRAQDQSRGPRFWLPKPGIPRLQPRGGFKKTVYAALAAYLLTRSQVGATEVAARTAATGVLLVVGLGVLVLVSEPLTVGRVLVTVGMAAAAVLAWVVPVSRHLFGLHAPPTTLTLASAAIAAGGLLVLSAAVRVIRPDRRAPSKV